MIKITFNTVSGTYISAGVTCAASAKYIKEDSGKKGVLQFTRKGYFGIYESTISLDGSADYFEADVKIAKDYTYDKVVFAKGTRIPFEIDFVKKGAGYTVNLSFNILDNNDSKRVKTAVSSKTVKPDVWFNIKAFFFDDELFILINNVIFIRRAFVGKIDLRANNMLYFAGPNSMGGFSMANLALSTDIYKDIDSSTSSVLNKAYDNHLFNVENAYWDAVDDGINPGTKRGSTKDETSGIICHRYHSGAIIENTDGRCFYMFEEFYTGFYSMNHQVSICGFPEREMRYMASNGKTVSYIVFAGKVIFYVHNDKYFRWLEDDMAARFLAADLVEYKNWYPVSLETMYHDSSNGVKVEAAEMSNGLVIYGVYAGFGDCHAIIVPAGIHKYYEKNWHKENIGLPLSDYTIYVAKDGSPLYYQLLCKEGWIKYFIRWDAGIFSDIELGQPTDSYLKQKINTKGNPVQFCNFEKGVIVKYPGLTKLGIHTGALIRLDKVTSGKIDDGLWDSSAELYIKLTVRVSNVYIYNRKRFGTKSYKGPRNYTFGSSNNQYSIENLKGEDYIRITVDVYDYDAASDDDYLGTFNYLYDVCNGWGLDNYEPGVNVGSRIYTLPMTAQGRDNRGGLNNIQLTLSCGEPYDMEKMKALPRKNLAFPFANFTGSYNFSQNDFNRIFSNAKYEWWNLGWLYDEIFYAACKNALSGAKCFGFAVAELNAINERGVFIPPLSNYNQIYNGKSLYGNLTYKDIEPATARAIVDYYLYQIGWDFLMWQWKKMCAGAYLVPATSIPTIQSRLKKEGFCILNVKPGDMNGHAVVAYKSTGSKLNTKFYIMDSNKPYRKQLEKDNLDPSYISFRKDNEVHQEVQVRYDYDSTYGKDWNYRYIFETPFSVVSHQPRVPTTWDILFGALETMIMGIVEGVANLFNASDSSGVIYNEKDGVKDYNKMMPIGTYEGPNGKPVTLFFLRNDKAEFKFKASKKGESVIKLMTPKSKVVFTTNMNSGEELTINTTQIHEIKNMQLSVKASSKIEKTSVKIGYGGHAACFRFYKAFSMPVYTTNTYIQGAKYGERLQVIRTFNVRRPRGRYLGRGKKTERFGRMISKYSVSSSFEPAGVIANATLTPRQYAAVYGCSINTARNYCSKQKIAGAVKNSKNQWAIPAKLNVIKYRRADNS